MAHPKCFSSEGQYILWLQANMEILKGRRAKTHCVDCTPAYQAEMVYAGRCEHPEIEFRISADGLLDGH